MNTIELARELGRAIQAEESYKKVVLAGDAIDADADLTALISEFAQKRELISMATEKEALEKLDGELTGLYSKIMENPKMIAFEEAKHEFGHLMERVMAIVTKSADGEDPATAEPDHHDCHGDCCSCHDCD